MFTIDLNDPAQVTRENVTRLLASVGDEQDWQLRVTSQGIAYLSSAIGNLEIEGLAFRLESWLAGNSYVGADASQDQEWVGRVLGVLQNNRPTPSAALIDHY
jgi:hypothetical protein